MVEALLIAFFAGISMVIGGLLVHLGKNIAKIQQISLALAAGSMIALLIFDLVPELIEEGAEIGVAPLIIAAIAGFFILVALDKTFHNAKYGHVHMEHTAAHFDNEHPGEVVNFDAEHHSALAGKHHGEAAYFHNGEHHSGVGHFTEDEHPRDIATEHGKHSHDPHPSNSEQGACTESYIHIGLISALALMLHNIIEGMAIYSVALASFESGLLYALAVVLHNIPIGMLLFVTLTRHSGNLQRIVIILVTLSTFIGALFALCLSGILDEQILSIFVAVAAGMLCYIVAVELIPRLIRTKPTYLNVISAVIGFLVVFGASFLGE